MDRPGDARDFSRSSWGAMSLAISLDRCELNHPGFWKGLMPGSMWVAHFQVWWNYTREKQNPSRILVTLNCGIQVCICSHILLHVCCWLHSPFDGFPILVRCACMWWIRRGSVQINMCMWCLQGACSTSCTSCMDNNQFTNVVESWI